MKMKIDKRSEEAVYVEINGWVIYLEVSSATKNKPYVSKWRADE
tara:strand:- start:7425 stop:7556 length:132 start_codon:yes stop_codon:yes gene_type:complete